MSTAVDRSQTESNAIQYQGDIMIKLKYELVDTYNMEDVCTFTVRDQFGYITLVSACTPNLSSPVVRFDAEDEVVTFMRVKSTWFEEHADGTRTRAGFDDARQCHELMSDLAWMIG